MNNVTPVQVVYKQSIVLMISVILFWQYGCYVWNIYNTFVYSRTLTGWFKWVEIAFKFFYNLFKCTFQFSWIVQK